MGRHEKPENYQRPQEEYSVRDLCHYARDILLTHGTVSGEQHGTVTTSWDSELASVYLRSSTQDRENPCFQLNVKDNRKIGHHRTYMLDSQTSDVTIYDQSAQAIPNDTPLELSVEIMHYLRSNLFVTEAHNPYTHVPEPLLDTQGEDNFQQLAATIAVQHAESNHQLNIQDVARSHESPFVGNIYWRAGRAALAQSITVGDVTLPYTRSSHHADQVIKRYAEAVRKTMNHRSLPKPDTQSDQP